MNLFDRVIRIKEYVSFGVTTQMTRYSLARVNAGQASSGRIDIFLINSKLLWVSNNAAEHGINVDERGSGSLGVVLYKGFESRAKISTV